MCTNPILIRNKKFRSLGFDIPSSFVRVPCGMCDECLHKRQNDLYARLRFEGEQTFLNGGNGFMCTLTYDNSNVPVLSYEGQKHFVFRKQDVIKFIKRLRSRLDRFFQRHYRSNSPDFKYFVASEFGQNPFATHRPHYHCIFLFNKAVSLYAFKTAFELSLKNQKTGERYFGKIFQCDLLDISKGGIKYCAKYVLKDVSYETQNIIIQKLIKFNTEHVNSRHSINSLPQSNEELLRNKVIRSTKAYKRDIETFVRPYRDMLQFYLVSNDMGTTAIIDRYGDRLFSLGMLNIEGFPYSIPKAVIQKVERSKGSDARNTIVKNQFVHQFKTITDYFVSQGSLSAERAELLNSFVFLHLHPYSGNLYLMNHEGFKYFNTLFDSPLRSRSDIYDEMCFYYDNGFYDLRHEVYCLINRYNSSESLQFRAKLALEKTCNNRERYVNKKRNQGYVF